MVIWARIVYYTVMLMNVKEIFLRSIRDAVDQPLYNAVVKENPFSGKPAATLGCGDHIFSRQDFNRVMEHFSKIDREHMVKSWDVDTGSRSQSEINGLHHLQLPGQSLLSGNRSLSRLDIFDVTPDIGMIPLAIPLAIGG